MPKAPPNPRHVEIRAVRRGEVIERLALTGDGTYVKEKLLQEGVFFLPRGAQHGFFVEAPRLWEELDKLID